MPRYERRRKHGRGIRVTQQTSSCIVAISPDNSFATLATAAPEDGEDVLSDPQFRTSFGQMTPSAQNFVPSESESDENPNTNESDEDENPNANEYYLDDDEYPRRRGYAGIGGIPNSHYFRLAAHGAESIDFIQASDNFPDFSDSDIELADGLDNFLAALSRNLDDYNDSIKFLPESRAMTDITREEDDKISRDDEHFEREHPSSEYLIETIFPVQFQGILIDGWTENTGSGSVEGDIDSADVIENTEMTSLPEISESADVDLRNEVSEAEASMQPNLNNNNKESSPNTTSALKPNGRSISAPSPVIQPQTGHSDPFLTLNHKWHEDIMVSLNEAWQDVLTRAYTLEFIKVQLEFAFQDSKNVFSTAAYLMLGADDLCSTHDNLTLTVLIGREFNSWLLKNRNTVDVTLLNEGIQRAAFSMLLMHKRKSFIPMICAIYSLKDIGHLVHDEILNVCKCGGFEEGALYTKFMGLNGFDAHAFVIPLILQGHEDLVYDYLKGKSVVQDEVIDFLEDVIHDKNPKLAISTYVTKNNILGVCKEDLTVRELRGISDRLSNLFDTKEFQFDEEMLKAIKKGKEARAQEQNSIESGESSTGSTLKASSPPVPYRPSTYLENREPSKSGTIAPRKSKYLTHAELVQIKNEMKKKAAAENANA